MMMLGVVAFALMGAILASFIHVVVERAYTGQSFVRGRSRCSSCSATLKPTELIPVVSWLCARGKCRTCGCRIPVMLFFSELFLGGLFVYIYLWFGLTPSLFLFLLFTVILFGTVLYDIRHTIVPPAASIALCIVAVVFSLLQQGNAMSLGLSYITAGVIGLGFLLLHVLSKGRAMGLGDAPVAFALSLMVAPFAFAGLLFSFWTGALVGIGILVLRRGGPTMGIEVPFVPFMAVGFFLAYFLQWNPLSFGLL